MRSVPAIRSARPLVVAVAFVALALLAGCGTTAPPLPEPSVSPSPSVAPPESPSAPEGPVVASWVVDAGTESKQEARVALHGVRRLDVASVLDWSVTPLAASGQSIGDPVGQALSVGMDEWVERGCGVSLLDLEARTVYRPLDDDPSTWQNHNVIGCLSTRWDLIEDEFQVGVTRVLQTAFPEVPDELTAIAVSMQGGPLTEDVPVAAPGKVLAGPTVDLAAPATPITPATPDVEFEYPASPNSEPEQRLSLRIDQILAGPTSTSLQLTVTALEDGPGWDAAPGLPLSDTGMPNFWWSISMSAVSGPGLRIGSETGEAATLRAWVATVSQMEDQKIGMPYVEEQPMQEALASRVPFTITRPDRLTTKGDTQTYFVQFPALPQGTAAVDVTFPDDSVAPFTQVPVTQATPVPAFSQEPAGDLGVWTPPENHYASGRTDDGWSLDQWPTPLPDPAAIAAADTATDELILVRTDDSSVERRDAETVEVTLDATVSFEPDSAVLTKAAKTTISRVAADIDQSVAAGEKILIEGHVAGTDKGSAAFQQRLSQDRADAVRDALAASVTVDVEFESVGRGAEQPVAPNDNEEDRKKNRRVVVTYRP